MAEVVNQTIWTDIRDDMIFGRAKYDFISKLKGPFINVKFGDLFRVIEECQDWYRCCMLGIDGNEKFIIPKTYVKIAIVKTSEKSQDDLRSKLRMKIWSTLQRTIDEIFITYKINLPLTKFIEELKFLLEFYKKMDDVNVSSKYITVAVDLLNEFCRNFRHETCRYSFGKLIDSNEMSFSSTFLEYISNRKPEVVSTGSSDDRSNISQRYTTHKGKTHPFHFSLDILRINIQNKGSYILECVIVDLQTMKYISQNYFYKFNSESWQKDPTEKPILFSNFSIGDLTNGILLLIKLIEMKKFVNEKDLSGQYLKVLNGLTGVNLKMFNDLKDSDFQTYKIPIIPIERMTKEVLDEAFEQITNHTNYDQCANSIEITIKKYNRPLLLLNTALTESTEEQDNKVKCILLKNYLHETIDMNEFYFTLTSADFRTFNKGGQYALRAEISLRDIEGSHVKNSISVMMNGKEEKHNSFCFNLVMDTETPFWNEMVKIILPKNNIEEYFLCIVFRKYFERNNMIKLKDKNDSAWAVAHFVKLESQSINTGDLKIPYFKMKLKNQVIAKVADESIDADKDFIRMIGGVEPQNQDTSKEFIMINSRIFSTRHSENQNISTLINCQRTGIKITDEILKQTSYSDFSELVIFYGKLIKLGITVFDSHTSSESFKSYFSYITSIISMSKYFENSELVKIHEKFLSNESSVKFITKFNDRTFKFFQEMKTAKYEIKQFIGSMMDCFVQIIRIFKPSFTNATPEDMNDFKKLIKDFFTNFNTFVKECMGESAAYILKYIVICPELVTNLNYLISAQELNEILKSILNLEELIKIDTQKSATVNYVSKIVENYSNTYLSILAAKNTDLLKLSEPWIISRVIKISNKLTIKESTVDVFIEIIEILEYAQDSSYININFNFIKLIEDVAVMCNEDSNQEYWSHKILKNVLVFFSLINIVDENALNEFLKKDQTNKYETSINILNIFEFFMQTSAESHMCMLIIEKTSKIIFKTMDKMIQFIKIQNRDESSSELISSIFKTSLNIIKFICEEGSSYIMLDLLENYTNVKNTLDDHTNILYSAFCLETKFKNTIYDNISTLLSLILTQKYNQNIFTIVYEFIVECCVCEEDITKINAQIYLYLEKNIDKMGEKIFKIKFLLTNIFSKMAESNMSEIRQQLFDQLKNLERMVDIISQCLLVKEQQYNPLFKLMKYQSIMKVSSELSLTDFTMSMMMRVKSENEKMRFLSEAAFIIRTVLAPEYRKTKNKKLLSIITNEEKSLLTATEYDQKSHNYFYAIKNCKLLIQHYEANGYPCDKISRTYQKMSDLSNELSLFNSNSLTFYQVAFFGSRFPQFMNNQSYIFYMGHNVKLGDSMAFFQSHIHFAKITNQIPKMEKSDENYIHLLAVTPKKPKFTKSDIFSTHPPLYDIRYCNFIGIETKSSKVDGKSVLAVFKHKFCITHFLPFYYSFSLVQLKKTREMSEADQSIFNFSQCLEDTNLAIKNFIRDSSTFKMLLMKLQGNMVAKVNGGIDQVIDKFFKDKYFEKNKSEMPKSTKLKNLLIEFMDSNGEAASLCAKNLPQEQVPLFNEIKNSHASSREILKKYNISCAPISCEDNLSTGANSQSNAEKSQSPKYATIFRKKPASPRPGTQVESKK